MARHTRPTTGYRRVGKKLVVRLLRVNFLLWPSRSAGGTVSESTVVLSVVAIVAVSLLSCWGFEIISGFL